MDSIFDIRDMVCKELDEVARKGELSAGSLDAVHKLTDILKNTYKIEMLEEAGEEYSHDGSYARGRNSRSYTNGTNNNYRRYSRDDMYSADDDMSMARGGRRGQHYVRGHYSYAEAADAMAKQIGEMMAQTDDAEIKDVLSRAKKKIENM